MGSAKKWNETAMLVIDMQKEFVDPNMSRLALPAGKAILSVVTEAVALARERGIFVVWVVREHDPAGRDVELFPSRINNLVVVGVQTPNCIRQTVFDAVALDYEKVTVITDATAAAEPEIHLANIRDMKNIGVETPTLKEWSG
ncbi:hypothetical protein QOZ80_2AG0109300 [Eleusine coracana subsp. coracana]|nr:hypothetical protein QOZ80_2AG0109300 [Eleusine coracana subsp. coracana]